MLANESVTAGARLRRRRCVGQSRRCVGQSTVNASVRRLAASGWNLALGGPASDCTWTPACALVRMRAASAAGARCRVSARDRGFGCGSCPVALGSAGPVAHTVERFRAVYARECRTVEISSGFCWIGARVRSSCGVKAGSCPAGSYHRGPRLVSPRSSLAGLGPPGR